MTDRLARERRLVRDDESRGRRTSAHSERRWKLAAGGKPSERFTHNLTKTLVDVVGFYRRASTLCRKPRHHFAVM
ncbi:hypothetical protein JOB18_037438 [Solea senegalensis]|uniref:Uncharacterized protein n=1 Tax=Solea senegalensis TaxID=28829 RepID=A0AAV6SUV1_SOLSE|nr:hypothetical protein JOB18_037438 [Solea senegalensis]